VFPVSTDRALKLFLAQKIEVGVTTWMRIHDSGKVYRESVGFTTLISQRKCKRDFQGNLRRSHDFAVARAFSLAILILALGGLTTRSSWRPESTSQAMHLRCPDRNNGAS
jgi:hypothetical protein